MKKSILFLCTIFSSLCLYACESKNISEIKNEIENPVNTLTETLEQTPIETPSETSADTPTDTQAITSLENDPYSLAIQQFFEDTNLPEIFTKKLSAELMQALYSYSYYEFIEKYRLQYNRTIGYADAGDIRIDPPENYEPGKESDMEYFLESILEYEWIQYHEFDFDGDGIDEIFIPIHGGEDVLYRKNSDGTQETGYSCHKY